MGLILWMYFSPSFLCPLFHWALLIWDWEFINLHLFIVLHYQVNLALRIRIIIPTHQAWGREKPSNISCLWAVLALSTLTVLEGVEGDKWGHTLTGYLATINFRVISVKKDSIKRSVKKKGSQQPRFCLMSVFQRPIIISIKNTNIASSSEDTDHLPMGELWTCLLLVLNTWLSFSLEKNFPCITFTWEES